MTSRLRLGTTVVKPAGMAIHHFGWSQRPAHHIDTLIVFRKCEGEEPTSILGTPGGTSTSRHARCLCFIYRELGHRAPSLQDVALFTVPRAACGLADHDSENAGCQSPCTSAEISLLGWNEIKSSTTLQRLEPNVPTGLGRFRAPGPNVQRV